MNPDDQKPKLFKRYGVWYVSSMKLPWGRQPGFQTHRLWHSAQVWANMMNRKKFGY